MELSKYLNAINKTKEDLFADESDLSVEKDYTPFVINRCLSYFPDTIFQVNEVNMYPEMPNKMQFEYLRKTIRPRSRFSKWQKKDKIDDLEVVKEYYGYSNRKAMEGLTILTEEQINQIKESLFRGGV
jgi:hypothetical protein